MDSFQYFLSFLRFTFILKKNIKKGTIFALPNGKIKLMLTFG